MKASQSLYETWRTCPTCHSGISAARVLAAAHNGLPLSLQDPDRPGCEGSDTDRHEIRDVRGGRVPIRWSEIDKVFEGLV